MRDPHVVALHYRLVTDPESFEFKNPPAVQYDGSAFRFRLEDGRLRAEMKDHHATADSAREVVEPFLNAWEIDAAIRRGRREMHFEYDAPEIIDRDPTPGIIELAAGATVRTSGHAMLKVIASAYPQPPSGFVASEDVRTLMLHFEAFVAGQERLVDAAYFCLTLVERHAGGRAEAAREFGIDVEVLRKVGFLTSDQVGDERTARKLSRKSTLRPHTGAEVTWLQTVLRRMIHRVGEHDFDPTAPLPTIAMAGLPPLSP